MERPYLNPELRRLVTQRADNLCEYCLISESDTILGSAIDHNLYIVVYKQAANPKQYPLVVHPFLLTPQPDFGHLN